MKSKNHRFHFGLLDVFFLSVMPLCFPVGEQAHTLYPHPRVNAEPGDWIRRIVFPNFQKLPSAHGILELQKNGGNNF